jgi:hypothetical protein
LASATRTECLVAARIAPFGSDAARASHQRIQRIAAREPELPSLLPAPRAAPSPVQGRSESTLLDGPPSEVGRVSVAVTGEGLSQSLPAAPRSAEPPPRAPRGRRTVGIGIAAVAAALAAMVAIGLWSRRDAARDTAAVAAPVCALDADVDNVCHQCRDQSCCAQYLACVAARLRKLLDVKEPAAQTTA